MAKKILFDMDGTLAMFYKNPACLECMYEEKYFKYLEPYTNVLIAAKMLIEQGYDVGVLSACVTPVSMDEKRFWMRYFLPEVKEENIVLCNVGENKSEVLTQRGYDTTQCILIDDYTKNCIQWEAGGGKAIKIINEINGKNGTWAGLRFNYEDYPEDIVEFIKGVAD